MVLLALTGCGADRREADFDLQFIDNMMMHHRGAVEMARAAQPKLTHMETKELARKIVSDQTREINQLMAWRDEWYKGAPNAKSDKIPGMDMQHQMGGDPDVDFIEMMIPHHQGAIKMAKEALPKAKHTEIRQLAQNIIAAQEVEINTMNEWKAAWRK